MQISTNANEYTTQKTPENQAILRAIRQTIQKAAPETEKSISYGVLAYKYCGRTLIYFACGKHHCGFYPKLHQE